MTSIQIKYNQLSNIFLVVMYIGIMLYMNIKASKNGSLLKNCELDIKLLCKNLNNTTVNMDPKKITER